MARLPAISVIVATAALSTFVPALGQAPPSTPRCSSSSTTLSPLAQKVANAVLNPLVLANSPVPGDQLVTHCNLLAAVWIDGPEIYRGIEDALAEAQHEIDLAFFTWSAACYATERIGAGIARAAAALPPRHKLLVRFLIGDDENDWSRVSAEVERSIESWDTDPATVEYQIATFPFGYNRNTLHDKFVVVDGSTLIVTGANPQPANDPRTNGDLATPWRDSAYRIEGDAARSALSAFDGMWTRIARHWNGSFPVPERIWLANTPYAPGDLSVIAVGRNEGSPTGELNPQNVAWTTLMDNATTWINIETPNINARGFQDALVRAVGRGVRVRLITTLGFNYTTMNAPTLGGDNQKVMGTLRKRIRDEHPNQILNFEACWFDRPRSQPDPPVVGKEEGPSHTKYMSVDGSVAMVGSGNMDSGSWTRAHEYNVLLDSPDTVSLLEASVFERAWHDSMCSYVELWESENATQSFDCPIPLTETQEIELKDFKPHFRERVFPLQPSFLASGLCNNDEARSIALVNASAGRVFRMFDHPAGRTEDDWLELRIKSDVKYRIVGSLEHSFDDEQIRAIYHRNNGLNGKTSRVTISTTPSGPTADFYESENAEQNLLCSVPVGSTKTVKFTAHSSCDNDEARSIGLYDIEPGRVLLLYDDPSGKREDDWLLIQSKRHVSSAIVGDLERTYEDADLRVLFFRNNGLNGKLSRLEVGDESLISGVVSLYEGNNGSQNKVCDLTARTRSVRFKESKQCDNDEARSLVLSLVDAGTAVRVFDDPKCRKSKDDWTSIVAKAPIVRAVVKHFEYTSETESLSVTFHKDNGLNGKVSCIEIETP